MALMAQFILEFYNPALDFIPSSSSRIDWMQIDPSLTNIVFTTSAPGGFNSLDVTVPQQGYLRPHENPMYPFMPTGVRSRDFAHVRLLAGQHIVWEGRIERSDGPGEDVRTFTAKGYGVSAIADQPVFTDDTTPQTGGAIIRRAIKIAAPYLKIAPGDLFQDPGVLHDPTEFNTKTAAQVVDQIMKEGGAANCLYDLLVWENGTVTYVPRTPPAISDYNIPYDDTTCQIVRDCSNMASLVDVRYTDINDGKTKQLSQPPQNTEFIDKVGIRKTVLVNGGNMSTASALSFAQTELLIRSTPTISATIKRSFDQGLQSQMGEVPPWIVRSGQWITTAGMQLIIVRTEFNASTGEFTIEAGSKTPGIMQIFDELRRVSSHVGRLSSPITGATIVG